jgi:hypothetical protein
MHSSAFSSVEAARCDAKLSWALPQPADLTGTTAAAGAITARPSQLLCYSFK